MINIPPIKARTEIKTELLGDITKTWKVGQVLNATVNKGGEPMDTVQLRIGQLLLESRTPVSLKAGDNIQLLVKELGIQPLLSIKTPVTTREAAIQLLRTHINSQQDIKPLLELSQKIANADTPEPEIRVKLQQFIELIARPQQATTAKQLKTLIQNSGVFLEPRLLHNKATTQTPGPLSSDIKSQLHSIRQLLDSELPVARNSENNNPIKLDQAVKQYLAGELNLKQLGQLLTTQLPADKLQTLLGQLQTNLKASTTGKEILPISIQQLISHIQSQPNNKSMIDNLINVLLKQPMLNELRTQIDNLLSKITSQQLLPLAKDADTPQFFLFDIPIKHNKETTVFQFRIDQEKKSASENESNWSVSINFEFDELGPVQSRINLHDNTISTLFHAERNTTASLIKTQLPILENALKRQASPSITLMCLIREYSNRETSPEIFTSWMKKHDNIQTS